MFFSKGRWVQIAKSKWEDVKEKLILVQGWAKDGLTDEQIAKNLGIAVDTFYRYKNKYSEFSEVLKKGKEVSDYEVESALFKKAIGYNTKVKKAFKVKNVEYDNYGKKVKEYEEIVLAEEEIHIPADTTAQIFWLKNRKPSKWKDKQDIDIEDNNVSITINGVKRNGN